MFLEEDEDRVPWISFIFLMFLMALSSLEASLKNLILQSRRI